MVVNLPVNENAPPANMAVDLTKYNKGVNGVYWLANYGPKI